MNQWWNQETTRLVGLDEGADDLVWMGDRDGGQGEVLGTCSVWGPWVQAPSEKSLFIIQDFLLILSNVSTAAQIVFHRASMHCPMNKLCVSRFLSGALYSGEMCHGV